MADYLAIVYDEASHPYTSYPSKLCAHLFREFGMRAGMKILEAGCGRGEFLREFQKLGLDARGLDLSPESASFLVNSGIPVDVCDIENEGRLPYADKSFDVVFSKSFMEHLRAPDAFLRETLRILKPGGFALCMIPDWESNYRTYFDDFTHKTPFTKVTLRDMLMMCDFAEVNVHRFRQLPVVWKYPVLNYLCSAISPFVPVRTENKFLRWSRELMLVGSGYRKAT